AFYAGIRSPVTGKWTERHLGDYPTLKLADARQQAREWVEAIREGKPLPERHGSTSFADVVERYIAEILPGKRSKDDCARSLRANAAAGGIAAARGAPGFQHHARRPRAIPRHSRRSLATHRSQVPRRA